MEGQVPRPTTFFAGSNLPDQAYHPPYVPPCNFFLSLNTLCVSLIKFYELYKVFNKF